jgi:CHAT domain
MELTLTRQNETQVQVACDGQPSHSFDLYSLSPPKAAQPGPPQPLSDPMTYGKAAYQALFPVGSLAHRILDAIPERILLITTDDDIDAVAWEYAYGPDGFLVADYPFARGLPPDQRIAPPALDSGLHIIAVPSDPLDKRLNPLNIDGEWTRLQEIIRKVPGAVRLERAYPPTIEQVRRQVANQRHRVVHFMGHGGQDDDAGAFLCLEKENGTLDPVTAKRFVQRVRGSVFLVTLNACVSATPGPTQFSNLAAALAQQKVPYALGMRTNIYDDDARAFSRQFYSELVSGVPVEEALLQARLTLANSSCIWAIGAPVLYTSLSEPAGGYSAQAGTPTIEEHRPPIDAFALPRAEGGFQGRIDELAQLGSVLTGDDRSPVVTIHSSGGQGKTALAREAIERFAFAWPGGIWAISLENLPSREVFLTTLARFLGLSVQEIALQEDLERRVLLRLSPGQPRTLIVLDNVETLIEAVHANDIAATNLAQFIRINLTRPPVSLLVTSRRFLDWQANLV